MTRAFSATPMTSYVLVVRHEAEANIFADSFAIRKKPRGEAATDDSHSGVLRVRGVIKFAAVHQTDFERAKEIRRDDHPRSRRNEHRWPDQKTTQR